MYSLLTKKKPLTEYNTEKMMDLLERQNIGKNNLRLIRNLNWTQEAAIRIDVNSDWTSINRGKDALSLPCCSTSILQSS